MTDEQFVEWVKGMEFEKKDFVPNLETEYRIRDASELEEGMVVLIHSRHMRMDLRLLTRSFVIPSEWKTAAINNRWCKISDIEMLPDYNEVRFTADYEPGYVYRRTVRAEHSWWVKR